MASSTAGCTSSSAPGCYHSTKSQSTTTPTGFMTPPVGTTSPIPTPTASDTQPSVMFSSFTTNSLAGSSATATMSSSATTTTAKPNALAAAPSSHAGTIAGSVVGGVVFLVLVILGILLYLRARKRKRTAPSSEFINSLKDGTAPVLRLDSGAEYTPALGEKSASYSAYPPHLSFSQNAYYSPPTKFPDEVMSDPPSGRPSVDRPLQPQRYSALRPPSDTGHHASSSVGSRRELWGSDTEVVPELSSARHSPMHADSALQFAPRFSLLDDSSSPPSHSPLSLHPLRRQPDP